MTEKNDALDDLASLILVLRQDAPLRFRFLELAALPENQRKIELERLSHDLRRNPKTERLADPILILRQNHAFDKALEMVGSHRKQPKVRTLIDDLVFVCAVLFALALATFLLFPRGSF